MFSKCLLLHDVVRVFVSSLVLYGPFCHGALKHDISTLFATFFVWTSLQFILFIFVISSCEENFLEDTDDSLPDDEEEYVQDSSDDEGYVPDSSVDEDSMPDSSVDEDSMPYSSNDEDSIPDSSVDEDSMPDSSNDEDSIPDSPNNGDSIPDSSNNEDSIPDSSNKWGFHPRLIQWWCIQ